MMVFLFFIFQLCFSVNEALAVDRPHGVSCSSFLRSSGFLDLRLTTARTVLRPLTENDLPTITPIMVDVNSSNMSGVIWTAEDAKQSILNGQQNVRSGVEVTFINFGIFEAGQLIGDTQLSNTKINMLSIFSDLMALAKKGVSISTEGPLSDYLVDYLALEKNGVLKNSEELWFTLGYQLQASSWGKGLATEAAAGTIKIAFEKLLASGVSATVLKTNTASIRVLEKLGFKRITESKHLYLYAQTRAEYEGLAKSH